MTGFQKFILRKSLWYLLTFFVALSLNFFLPRFIKGNPVSVIVDSLSSGMTDTDSMKRLYETFNE